MFAPFVPTTTVMTSGSRLILFRERTRTGRWPACSCPSTGFRLTSKSVLVRLALGVVQTISVGGRKLLLNFPQFALNVRVSSHLSYQVFVFTGSLRVHPTCKAIKQGLLFGDWKLAKTFFELCQS